MVEIIIVRYFCFLSLFPACIQAMDVHYLHDGMTDFHGWVEGGKWILENKLDFLPVFIQLLPSQSYDRITPVLYVSCP